MNETRTLAVGSRVIYDGDSWEVTAINGPGIVLESARRPTTRVPVRTLLASTGFRFASDTTPPPLSDISIGGALTKSEYRELLRLEEHLRELETGFRSGDPSRALPGEPRSEYLLEAPKMAKYQAKAQELGTSPRDLQRKLRAYREDGLRGLVDLRSHRKALTFGRVDPRWVDTARQVLVEHVDESQPDVLYVRDRVDARVEAQFGSEVRLPSLTTARRVLGALGFGKQAFSGSSAKQKRGNANRPPTPYGHLCATRVGQYLQLDTSPIDVFAFDPLGKQWVNTQLTLALDIAPRSITGVRVSPASANAVDAALVLYESIHPNSRAHTSAGLLPYGGVPDCVVAVVDPERPGLPGVAPETVIIDHGKMYFSKHTIGVCERLGISVQPAREYTPTDKAFVERFFRTLRVELLSKLPGYKGPDVNSRGKNIEETACLTIDELEEIIREWISTYYHRRPHAGLHDPSVPTLKLSPNEMWDLISARTGVIVVPRRADLAYDFLPEEWCTIQHYGVQVNSLRYDGPGLEGLRNQTSPYVRKKGRWPVRFDPGDATRVFLQRPDDHTWVTLKWEHASDFPVPFSVDSVRLARRLAVEEGRHGQVKVVLAELLEKFGAGLADNPAERRVALREAAGASARVALAEIEGALPGRALDVEDHTNGGVHGLTESGWPETTFDSDDDSDDDFEDDAEFYATALRVGL